jgi:hypothetical protein
MGHLLPSSRQAGTASEPDAPLLPAIHRSVGVATIVALMKAHRGASPASAELEEGLRIDAWAVADMLPEDSSAPSGSCDMASGSR